MTTLGYEPVHKLSAADSIEFFDCAHPAVNQFLQRYALVNQKANSAQTYVCRKDSEVVGISAIWPPKEKGRWHKTIGLKLLGGKSACPV